MSDAKERFVGENFMRAILDKGPDSVTEDEKDVLRARRTYLTRDEIEKFNLFPKEEEKQAPAENSEPEKEKTAKGKAAKGK